MSWTDEGWTACQAYAERVGKAEYQAGLAAHVKAGRSRRTFLFTPSAYLDELCRLLGYGTEEEFKALKMTEGRGSPLGH